MSLDRSLMEAGHSNFASESERYVASLCEKAFLSLWSYPNPFRNQGNDCGVEGKEICDLLVVFGRDIIIFSDKYVELRDSGRPLVDWSRWYRAAVVAGANQAYGAERWIRCHPDRIFVDRQCTCPLRVELPQVDMLRVHRIVVVHGARGRASIEL